MAEKAVTGAGSVNNRQYESVCVHTRKIYSSCKDKDCIEDLRFYPTESAQTVLSTAQSIRGGSAELLYTFVDVEPVNFNRGYFTVDMRFYYRIVLQVMNGGARYTEAEGLAVFDKRVILFGSESSAKIFSSEPVENAADAPLDLSANLPTAVVEAVDPMLLCAHIADGTAGECVGITVPDGILEVFSEPLVLDGCAERYALVTLGQFSMVRLERDTQLLMPIYDYCVPTEECSLANLGGCSTEDPCSLFEDVDFPVDAFFPPSALSSGTDGACGCKG